MRDTRLAITNNREPVVMGWMSADRRVDRPGARIRMSLHKRMVGLRHLALFELILQRGIGHRCSRKDHQSARPNVEPMNDSFPLVRPRISKRDPDCGQTSSHGWADPARAGVRGHPNWFCDDDNVIVQVPNFQPIHRLHCLRDRFVLLTFGNIQNYPNHKAVRPANGPGPDRDESLGNQISGFTPRHSGQP